MPPFRTPYAAVVPLLAVVLLAAGCTWRSTTGDLLACAGPVSVSAHRHPGGAEVRWRGVDCRGRLEISGDVELAEGTAPDDVVVRALAAGARIEAGESRQGRERRLVVVAGPGGAPRATGSVDGAAAPFDAEARSWLAGRLLLALRETGYGAEARVDRILDRFGAGALLAEVEEMGGDAVQRLYLETALVGGTGGRLSAAEERRALATGGRVLGSDGDLAALLVAAVERPAVAALDAAERDALLTAAAGAAGSIGSDGEHRRALAAALAAGGGPVAQTALLDSAAAIGSDGDLAALLAGALDVLDLAADGPRRAFAAAAGSIGSDGDHAAVLSALARRPHLAPPVLAMLLDSAAAIGSDADLADVLVAVAEHQAAALDGGLREAYLRTAGTLGSEAERRRAREALGRERRASISRP